MRIVRFSIAGAPARYGQLTADGVLPYDDGVDLPELIESVETVRAQSPVPLESARLLAPVPWPGKILVTTATYGARPEPVPQLLATLKSPESVIGPGETVQLPQVAPDAWQFVPQAMLGLVIRGPAKDVAVDRWQDAVFGYTCVVDVMAKGDQQFGRDYWLAKSDTLGPLGPCIVTLDEIAEVDGLRVRSWQNGAAAQDFVMSDASHSVGEQVALATTVMTLHTGDILACGTAPIGPRALRDGDSVAVEIDGVGRLEVQVA